MLIKELWAENWRSFGSRSSVPLSPLTLLIGPNNAGKSNVLQILERLGGFVRVGNPVDTLVAQTFAADLRGNATRAGIGLSFSRDASQGSYSLEFSRSPTDWVERLMAPGTGFSNAAGKLAIQGSSAQSFPRMSALFREGRTEVDGELADLLTNYKIWRASPAHLDDASQVEAVTRVGPSGEKAAAHLDHLRDAFPQHYGALQEDLKACAPEVHEVVAVGTKDAPGYKEIHFKENNGTLIPSRHVSEGLKFLLFVLLILHSPDPPRLLAFEEIEHGVHPRRIADMVGFLRRLVAPPNSVQVLVTTHSPLVLDQFRDTPEEVVLVERDARQVTICTRLSERLKEIDGKPPDVALGDLWFSGVLGGVPKT